MKRCCFKFLILICAFLVSCKGGPDIKEETLAVVGERKINADDFIKRYNEFRQKTGDGVPDTYDTRRKILNLYVDEEILITEAERQGLSQDHPARQELERIKIQELLTLFNKQEIAAKVSVSDEELKELFVNLNTQLKARHLYAPTREEAQQLYARLQNGASFQELAKETFMDEHLKNTGGFLGYFSVDEMEPNFETAAFDLQIGETSGPVKTSDGYSIIRVEDRKTNPMLTENEYAKHKHKLYAYWRNRKIKQAISAYTDFLGRSLNISFHENTLQRFFEAFEENPEEEGLETSGKFDFLDDAILFDSEIGNWTVADFRNYARFTAIEHQKFIKNIERFKEFITGLAVRQKILSLAKESNLHKSPEYEKQVAEKKDIYLLTRFEKQIASEMVIPEDSLHAYYERNQEIFAEPAKVNLREIVLNSQEAAKNVGRKLDNGESFPELALKYSERKWTAERGGELGYLAAQDFGKWSDLAFSMEPGERKGPVEIDSAYVFLQCIDKVPAKPRSFEAARDDVVEAVRFALKDDYRANRIQEFRQNIDVTVMTSKLKQLNIY